MRVAIVHYWFVSDRGGEKVVEAILKIFPDADIFTHVIDREGFAGLAAAHNVRESFIGRLPGARRHYQKLLPLMPLALEQLDLRCYDLVISSESGPAKGVLIDPGALHVCYCHSPMRYLWDMYHDYREKTGRLTRMLMPFLTHYLRLWDQHSANRVDYFIANSQFIKRRIRKTYRRDAVVINPPVNVEAFEFCAEKDDYFLLLGQLTAYKRPDLAIEAFANMPNRRLVVVGEGEMLSELRRRNLPNVTFTGRQPFDEVRRYLQGAKALIFPGVEDFGIVPVEALACGTPVIAFANGGVLETVTDGETGLYFHEQTSGSLSAALLRFDAWEMSINRHALRAAAERFNESRFRKEFAEFIDWALAEEAVR
jgi:glycosyltransferase involved in cell wall biosynthesis